MYLEKGNMKEKEREREERKHSFPKAGMARTGQLVRRRVCVGIIRRA